MGGSRVEELHITPAMCAALVVEPEEIFAGARRLEQLSGRLGGYANALHDADRALAHAGTVPGGALSAAPARLALALALPRLYALTREVDRLSAAVRTAGERYEEAELSAMQSFQLGLTSGVALWRELNGGWIPQIWDPGAPMRRFFHAAGDHHLNQVTQRPLHTYPHPRVTIAALFSAGAVRFRQIRALSPAAWFHLLTDLHGTGRHLGKALRPIVDPNAPGIDRAEGALLARSLSRVLTNSGEVGDGAALGARGVEALHSALGHRRIRMVQIPAKADDADSTRAPIRSFSDSIAVMEELKVGEGTESGELRIDRVTSQEGEVSWQVFFPGGQGFDPGNVHSLLHTLSAVDGGATPSMTMALAALREVGVKKGEPIVMVGHSHGGITATVLANNPRVRAEFDIPLVITAGSPTDRIDIRPDTHVIALEHTEDFVTGLEGVEWQAKPGMTRVERTLAESFDPEISAGVGVYHSHDYPNYIDTARLADEHPDLSHQRGMLEALIPEGEVETFRFRADITR